VGGSIRMIVPLSSYGLPCHRPRWISELPTCQSDSVRTPKNHSSIAFGVVRARQTSSIAASIVTEWVVVMSVMVLGDGPAGERNAHRREQRSCASQQPQHDCCDDHDRDDRPQDTHDRTPSSVLRRVLTR
jgi:hypothetical protein